jgi:hypothetical protein
VLELQGISIGVFFFDEDADLPAPTLHKQRKEEGREGKEIRNGIDANGQVSHDTTLAQFKSGKGVAHTCPP